MKQKLIHYLKICWYYISIEKQQLDYFFKKLRRGINLTEDEAEVLKELIKNENRIYGRTQ